jgi:hypothetical protein
MHLFNRPSLNVRHPELVEGSAPGDVRFTAKHALKIKVFRALILRLRLLAPLRMTDF